MTPFLTLPFSEKELEKHGSSSLYNISEGYIYHPGSLHGYALHAGIDYHVPYGTNVYSPCDGYAVASYNFQRATDTEGNIKTTNGLNISYGLGYCVQIYNPTSNLFVLFGHLSSLAPEIIYEIPRITKDDFGHLMYSASGFNLKGDKEERIYRLSSFSKIHSGQFLGQVGLSGLLISNTFPDLPDKPLEQIPFSNDMYTLPHLHMNIFSRDIRGTKEMPIDPYDIYDFSDTYPTHSSNDNNMGSNHLFITHNNLPQFAC